ARMIAVQAGGKRRVLALNGEPPAIERTADLRDAHWLELIRDAFAILLRPAEGPIRVIGHGMGEADMVEVVLDERPLRAAMLAFSRNILILSLIISGITAG